jgi:predicted nucleic acid-binding protein
MILLDTNVVSEPHRPTPDRAVQDWLNRQPAQDLFLCTPVLAELRYGFERLPSGARRNRLESWLQELEQQHFVDRILPFDQLAAHEFGRIMSRREKIGRPIKPLDALIAAIAVCHTAPIATRDTMNFADLGLELINPFEAPAPR